MLEVHFGDDPKKCYERLLRGFQDILKTFQWKCFSSLEKTIRFLETEYISIHYSAEVKLYIRDALTLYLDGQTHFKYLAARKQMLQDF